MVKTIDSTIEQPTYDAVSNDKAQYFSNKLQNKSLEKSNIPDQPELEQEFVSIFGNILDS